MKNKLQLIMPFAIGFSGKGINFLTMAIVVSGIAITIFFTFLWVKIILIISQWLAATKGSCPYISA